MNLIYFRAGSFMALCALWTSVPAQAADEAFEFWLNPSVSVDLDDDTGLELETAQRFRSKADGRVDTYYARLWLNQALSKQVTLGAAVERRINDGGSDETRLMQQLSTRHGMLRTRLRLEERFVDDTGRMGLRVQPRLGVSVPLGEARRWSLHSNAELFLTLKSTAAGGDDGLTGFRTQVGMKFAASDALTLGLTYLRHQDFRRSNPDRVGHVPLVEIEYSF